MSFFYSGQHIADHVDTFVFGVLHPDDADYVESHCAECEPCRMALEEARSRQSLLQSVPPLEASDELVNSALDNVDRHVRRQATVRRIVGRVTLYVTAASILVLATLNIYYARLSPSQYDLRILGQTDLLADSTAALRVRLLDHQTRQPLANVPIVVTLVNHDDGSEMQLAETTTDEHGQAGPQLNLPDWQDGSFALRVVATTPDGDETIAQHVTLRRSWQLAFTTDKPVYQPGQVIHLRSLALRRPDLKPVSGQDLVFSITDPAGNVIFIQRDVTSRFGIASADCPLATEILAGTYRVECLVGETSSSRNVEVQKYVLPKFKASVELDQPYYQLGDVVRGKVNCRYFFGKTVNDAQIHLQAFTEDVTGERIFDLTESTNEAGELDFEFQLPQNMVGLEQHSGAARFRLIIMATDRAGQTNTAAAFRSVVRDPIQLTVIPESRSLVQDLANTIYVYASYPDGRPVQARLAISGFAKEFATDQLGVARFEVTPDPAVSQLTFKATDSEGRSGRRTVDLRAGGVAGDFIVRPDHSVLDGGDTLSLTVLGEGSEPVFLDLIQDNQTIVSQIVDVVDGRGTFDFDLPVQLAGTVRVCAYRINGNGLAIRKSRAIYVRQRKDVRIEAELDKREYRPGEKATIRLSTVDNQGQPVVAALGLSAVDEAVFSVLGPTGAMQKTFFLLEQEMLKPVYAIYDWSPGQQRDAEPATRQQFQQALFSATASVSYGESALPLEFSGADSSNAVGTGDFAVEAMIEPEVPDIGDGLPIAAEADMLFTLAAASYPEKSDRVRRQRRSGLQAVAAGWWSLLGFLVLAGMVAFACFRPRAFMITLGIGCCLLLLAGLLTPAVLSSRNADDATPWLSATGIGMADGSEMAFPMEANGRTSEAVPRVRRHFPETLLWQPEVITDEHGIATIDLELADSITSWRLSANAVTADGQLGAKEIPIRVFQPFFVDFNLPVALTRNDEVAVPVVIYNYLNQPQTVELQLEEAAWFELVEDPSQQPRQNEPQNNHNAELTRQTVQLQPGEVHATSYRIKVLHVGHHHLQVLARGGDESDAVRRPIEVIPDGRGVQQLVSGTLDAPAQLEFEIPDRVIDGSAKLLVKLYPSTFSQLVEGLDSIFRMPHGCFEQASSTTYPNILALDYLRNTNTNLPQIEAKARNYIHLGYQRLISFEVSGGGFDWFGNPPANRTLTAYGLMEFCDMASVHDVDEALIERTRQWLLEQRRGNGAWPSDQGMLNDGLTSSVQAGNDLELAATAYIAWAVFGDTNDPQLKSEAQPTLKYLLAQPPAAIQNTYLLSMIANAIAAIDNLHPRLADYLNRLEELKTIGEDGKKCWWSQPQNANTVFYGSGRSGDIETTALAALAMIESGQYQATTRGALRWLIEQKGDGGTWHSTQATVLALKALLAGTGSTLGTPKPRQIEIAINDQAIRTVNIPADQADVVQQIPLSQFVSDPGRYRVTLTERSETQTGYQIDARWHVEDTTVEPPAREPLSVDIQYDRERLSVNDQLGCRVRVTNNMPRVAPMVLLDLPIPAGFVIQRQQLDDLVQSQRIAKYQITPRKAILYLRQLIPGAPLELEYQLQATMPLKIAVPAGQAYLYYDPDQRGIGGAAQLEVTGAT